MNTKGKYVKVTNAEIKWSIISRSVIIITFVEFIDQLIDYIDHEIFSAVILSLLLIQEGQLSVSGERMCTILVNHLED